MIATYSGFIKFLSKSSRTRRAGERASRRPAVRQLPIGTAPVTGNAAHACAARTRTRTPYTLRVHVKCAGAPATRMCAGAHSGKYRRCEAGLAARPPWARAAQARAPRRSRPARHFDRRPAPRRRAPPPRCSIAAAPHSRRTEAPRCATQLTPCARPRARTPRWRRAPRCRRPARAATRAGRARAPPSRTRGSWRAPASAFPAS